jgi:hypothetical protein
MFSAGNLQKKTLKCKNYTSVVPRKGKPFVKNLILESDEYSRS